MDNGLIALLAAKRELNEALEAAADAAEQGYGDKLEEDELDARVTAAFADYEAKRAAYLEWCERKGD